MVLDAIDSVSVTVDSELPAAMRSASVDCWYGVSGTFVRAERSAAMMLRARRSSVARKAEENPRTPVSAATPIATERMTKANLPREERSSLLAMRAAVV